MASHPVAAAVAALAIALVAPSSSLGRADTAQGCGLVKPAELHAIFHAKVKTRPGETSMDCNFFAPKTSNVLLSVGKMGRAQFEKFRKGEMKFDTQTVTNVSGLGGPAYWVDPNEPEKLGYGLYILHGRYQIQMDAGALIPQLHETRQATHSQLLKMSK